MYQIEQLIEPATRIGRRPPVQLGLHLRYPTEHLGRSVAIQLGTLRHCLSIST